MKVELWAGGVTLWGRRVARVVRVEGICLRCHKKEAEGEETNGGWGITSKFFGVRSVGT
jgi:hypothetical protein